MITPADVTEFDAALTGAGIAYWITGGWGIDALVGRQTRDHVDLDISIPATSLDSVLALFDSMGFRTLTDWLPTRIALGDDTGREVDVHPLRFELDGAAWLPGLDGNRFEYPHDSFTTGTVDGHTVPCISAALQVTLHTGYPKQEKDIADMATLRDFGLVPEAPA